MIHIDKVNKRIHLTRYLLMEDGYEIMWVQHINEKELIGGIGYFLFSHKYDKSNGSGILRRIEDRQTKLKQRAKKPPFNKKEAKIINTLFQHQRPLTTGKVTKYAGFSYNTTKKYLRRLEEKGYVKSTHYGNAVYWWLREVEEGERNDIY